jgi:hypothetical protein
MSASPRATRRHGEHDVRFDTVADPIIEEGRDAIVKVSTCAICGSDLHLFDGFMPIAETVKLCRRCALLAIPAWARSFAIPLARRKFAGSAPSGKPRGGLPPS